jgi:Tfp pilus assembly PilM family ATPase
LILSGNLGWIGVDVGTHTVKLAQAVRTPLGVVLRHAAVVQRSSSWPDDDELALAIPVGSSSEIRAALECGNFRGRNAACLLPMNVCELRGLKVPAGDVEERRAMIANELADDWVDRALPMEFDFWEVAVDKATESPESFNVNVISVALPWVSRIADDCHEARLDCWAVDGGPLAIARAVRLATRLRSDQRVLAVDWGFSNATLCVVGNDRPLYARRLHHCSFRRCLEAIQSQLGVSQDRAQHLADTHGVAAAASDDVAQPAIQGAIADAVGETVGQLVDEIQRTLKFFESQRRHLRPNAVWLMGGGASMRNIGPHLCDLLEMPVHVWSVPIDPQLGDVADGNHSALFGTAVALSALAWRAA